MAEWRDRKYVPDSDEEEEGLSINEPATQDEDVFIHVDSIDQEANDHDTSSGLEDHPVQPASPACYEQGVSLNSTPFKGNSRPTGEIHEQTQGTRATTDVVDTNNEIEINEPQLGQPVSMASFQAYKKDRTFQLSSIHSQYVDDEIDELQQSDNPGHLTKWPRLQLTAELLHQVEAETVTDAQPNERGLASSLSTASSQLSEPESSVLHDLLPTILQQPWPASSIDQIGLDSSTMGFLERGKGAEHLSQEPQKPSSSRDDKTSPNKLPRTLRQRNPIQLHPYVIEGQRYRQTLRARGIKPLRIDQVEVEENSFEGSGSQQQIINKAINSQTFSSDAELQDLASSALQNVRSSQSLPPSISGEEEELPDISTLFRRAPDAIVQGKKRRKVTHTFSKKVKEGNYPRRTAVAVLIEPLDHTNLTEFDMNGRGQDEPLSPPISAASSTTRDSMYTKGGFRYPPGMTPAQLNTPVTSSNKKISPAVQTYQCNTEDPVSSDIFHQPSLNSASDTEPPSDSENDHQLYNVQRKIRGVLPASFLRLNLKAGSKSTKMDRSTIRDSPSPIRVVFERGVARPLSSHRHRDDLSARSLAISISDNSSSEHSLASNSGGAISPRSRSNMLYLQPNFLSVGHSMEVAEDNRIDFMLPPKRRTSSIGNRNRVHKTKHMGDRQAARSKTETSLFKSRTARRGRQPKISEHITRKVEAQNQPRKMSILDITERAIPRSVPSFLRIAARTTRSRADRGKHSPSRKFLRLATREDTADVQATLDLWARGGPSDFDSTRKSLTRSFKAHPRLPLEPCSGNERIHLDDFVIPEEEHGDGDQKPRSRHKVQYWNTVTKSNMSRRDKNLLGMLRRGQPRQISRLRHTIKRNIQLKHSHTSSPPYERLSFSIKPPFLARPSVLETNYGLHGLRRGKTMSSEPQILSKVENYIESCKLSGNPLQASQHSNNPDGQKENAIRLSAANLKHASRKRCPNQLNINTLCFQQDVPSRDVPERPLGFVTKAVYEINELGILQGLGPFGTEYSTTFDIAPLAPGTRFDLKSFFGSGEFSRSLATSMARDLDDSTHLMELEAWDMSFQWGPWSDTVSSQLSTVYQQLVQAIQRSNESSVETMAAQGLDDMESAIRIQRSVIRYFADSLYFLDPVDRFAFVQRCYDLATLLYTELGFGFTRTVAESTLVLDPSYMHNKYVLQMTMQNLAMTYQVCQIASHVLVPESLRLDLEVLLGKIVRQLLATSVPSCMTDAQNSQQNCIGHSNLSHDTRFTYEAEAIVVVYQVLKHKASSNLSFWDEVFKIMRSNRAELPPDVQILEFHWKQLFNILPLFDFDAQGVIAQDQCSDWPASCWQIVKGIVRPVLDTYVARPSAQGTTFNSYCRAVLERCLVLIKIWKWRRCETMILTFFDFFASINLGHLRKEESNGSPLFIENLTSNINLTVVPGDRSFHIFLKLLGTGLHAMRAVYSDKKIRDITWRMMPNHDRRHPKDEVVSQQDLEALRNHHDLLSVLYWASPCGFRPRVKAIQSLVHLENSHKEACQISVRAWKNLVNFQLSTVEPVSSLEPFADWYDEILKQVLRQHSLARTEIEHQVRTAEFVDDIVPRDLQESTIAKNQRQVEAILSDALLALKKAIGSVRAVEHAQTLLSSNSFGRILDMFDTKQPRINLVVVQALDVILAFISSMKRLEIREDSQSYGDWSIFDEELETTIPVKDNRLLDVLIYRAVRRLLSNCFGSDTLPEDNVLLKVVQVWAAIAQHYVGEGAKAWIDYVGVYGEDCWNSLSGTEQTHRFTVNFYATLIERNEDLYRKHRQLFLKSWIASLVERESLLKFQHQLTCAILNADCDNPILANLPFWVDSKTGRFEISSTELRDRRLSLISCLLSNMRESLDFSTYHRLEERTAQKVEYSELVRQLMTTMKQKYEDLGSGSTAKSAYVEFVQVVVENLQQHCTEICPIDRFFTDPATFPLPAKDPTYIVGRLRSYGYRLQDTKIAKQLSVFILAVSERAAVDGQQGYLVEQLSTAMCNCVDSGGQSRLALRLYLLQGIFPAYIELAPSSSCGSLLAMPILEALERVFEHILEDLNGLDESNAAAAEKIISTVLHRLQQSTTMYVSHPEIFEEPLLLSLLANYYGVLKVALPVLDYLARLQFRFLANIGFVAYFKEFADYACATLFGYKDVDPPSKIRDDVLTTQEEMMITQSFTINELRNTLQRSWTSHDGRVYHSKGKTRIEILSRVGSQAAEKERLLSHIGVFRKTLDCMPLLSDIKNLPCAPRHVSAAYEDLVF